SPGGRELLHQEPSAHRVLPAQEPGGEGLVHDQNWLRPGPIAMVEDATLQDGRLVLVELPARPPEWAPVTPPFEGERARDGGSTHARHRAHLFKDSGH